MQKKIEQGVSYILQHPVQFGASGSDRVVLMSQSEFKTDFESHLKQQNMHIKSISVRQFAKITWNFYTLWVNRPHTIMKG